MRLGYAQDSFGLVPALQVMAALPKEPILENNSV